MRKPIQFIATHAGFLVGDARVGGAKRSVLLRETKLHWVSEQGRKYKKSSGWPTGGDHWPMWTLDAESVKPLPQANP
jgi:hypothetical protein